MRYLAVGALWSVVVPALGAVPWTGRWWAALLAGDMLWVLLLNAKRSSGHV